MMRLYIFLLSIILASLALTPEEEACANPLMAKLAKEPDVDTKKFVTKCFKLITAGKRDDVKPLVKKFDHDKFIKFLDEYMIGDCSSFREEFEGMM
ncbi:hypothetical protein PRIPAC_78690 [Pristionchus pacificus]|uniref:Uncharacterized protein n=1 Tax=Pristionchus pacificus TaxID=54126 RepID=A0A2A6C2Y2_PRIPA|nr:hypothetical protein PRIPAC_78690 [Pristionchus pacificus]|eukprot:PDM72469.1 hypothetical protein PRIPAC_38903 [Pristionchus pacificus]